MYLFYEINILVENDSGNQLEKLSHGKSRKSNINYASLNVLELKGMSGFKH